MIAIVMIFRVPARGASANTASGMAVRPARSSREKIPSARNATASIVEKGKNMPAAR